jgi:hypothetical protein
MMRLLFVRGASPSGKAPLGLRIADFGSIPGVVSYRFTLARRKFSPELSALDRIITYSMYGMWIGPWAGADDAAVNGWLDVR